MTTTSITFADVLADAVKALHKMPLEITQALPSNALEALAALPDNVADDLALALVRAAARCGHAGTDYYLPVCNAFDRTARNALIRAQFNGGNLREICRRYDVSKTTVYRVVRRNEAA